MRRIVYCAIDTYPRAQWPRPRRCPHPAKGTLEDGTPACGIHLAVEARHLDREVLAGYREDDDDQDHEHEREPELH